MRPIRIVVVESFHRVGSAWRYLRIGDGRHVTRHLNDTFRIANNFARVERTHTNGDLHRWHCLCFSSDDWSWREAWMWKNRRILIINEQWWQQLTNVAHTEHLTMENAQKTIVQILYFKVVKKINEEFKQIAIIANWFSNQIIFDIFIL